MGYFALFFMTSFFHGCMEVNIPGVIHGLRSALFFVPPSFLINYNCFKKCRSTQPRLPLLPK